jgi:ATP-binding protein involved in chromosome partitioning
VPTIETSQILKALSEVIDPDLGKDIVTLGFVGPDDITIDGAVVKATVYLTTPACPVKDLMKSKCVELIEALPGVETAEVTMDARTVAAQPKADDQSRLKGVKNILAVGSGKGGVGKSTVAANLAYALRQAGATVGILDADIYGPSLPILLGLKGEAPTMSAEQKINPIEKYGMKAISMGFLLKESDAVVWRGPMLGKALQQFIDDVDWGELDYLVIDLPPGTGDVQLSLSQLIGVDGAVIVTTPQDVAFADVRRAIRMFQMTKVPLLGLVENMSYFHCPDNDKTYHIFGEGRTASHAEEHRLDFLGQLPIDPQIGPAADKGELIAIADPSGLQASKYADLAGKVAAALAKRAVAKEKKEKLKGFFKVSAN